MMRRKGEEMMSAIRRSFRLFFTFSLFFFSSLTISAATLSEYREKIKTAEIFTAELMQIEGEYSSPSERAEYEPAILAELRESLPVSEKIEWKGTSVETDNKWLHEKLDEFEREKNSARRDAILNEIGERLAAIVQKLDELEAPAVSNRTKDEDKQKLGEILRREEYRKPEKKGQSFIERLIEKISGWFGKGEPREESAPAPAAGFKSFTFAMQILLYAVIFALVGFLIYRFAPFLATRFRQREKRGKRDRVILGERIAADETSENLFSEAERLAREGNMRGAIRKGYIALLCELSDRKVIGLSRHKTNRDYLRDVRKKRELYENMNGLTANFERHWYGFEEAEEKDWEEFRNGYRKAVGN